MGRYNHISDKTRDTFLLIFSNFLIWFIVIGNAFVPYRVYYSNATSFPELVSTDSVASSISVSLDSSAVKDERAGEIVTESTQQTDIESLIRKTFPECPDTMVAIARAESHFRTNAINVNRNGTKDCGIFQVNSIHGYDCEWLFDVQNNLKAARAVFDKQGLNAWMTYRYAVENNLPI